MPDEIKNRRPEKQQTKEQEYGSVTHERLAIVETALKQAQLLEAEL